MEALAMPPPEGSSTVPAIAPVAPPCAIAGPDVKPQTPRAASTSERVDFLGHEKVIRIPCPGRKPHPSADHPSAPRPRLAATPSGSLIPSLPRLLGTQAGQERRG